MYVPKNWHWFGPLLPVTANLYIMHNMTVSYDVALFVLAPLAIASASMSVFIGKAGEIWQRYEAGETVPAPRIEERQRIKTNFNSGELVLEQVADLPVRTNGMNFCQTLIQQRNGNLEVNLTESYWIKGKHWKGSRDTFVAYLSMLEKRNGIRRKSGGQTSGYEPNDWRVIRLGAKGAI